MAAGRIAGKFIHILKKELHERIPLLLDVVNSWKFKDEANNQAEPKDHREAEKELKHWYKAPELSLPLGFLPYEKIPYTIILANLNKRLRVVEGEIILITNSLVPQIAPVLVCLPSLIL